MFIYVSALLFCSRFMGQIGTSVGQGIFTQSRCDTNYIFDCGIILDNTAVLIMDNDLMNPMQESIPALGVFELNLFILFFKI